MTDQAVEETPNTDAPEPEAEEAAGELAVRHNGGITERLRGSFDPGQMELIRTTVAKDCNPAELAMFLEICARYQLDPFAKQIWAAKMGGNNGPVTIMVSRDGLLMIANRHKDYGGMDGDVVRENDVFIKKHDSGELNVEHEVNKTSAKERGEVTGAWAVVYREGRRPTYFFAQFDQYNRPDATKSPWKKQKDAMILKVAESMALRKAFSITGVVGEDEMTPQLLTAAGQSGSPEVEWPEDEELVESLKQAFSALGYTQAKIRLSVNGKSKDELEKLVEKLNAEADAQAEEVEGEVVDAK